MKAHNVGGLTFGCLLVLFGVLFLFHTLFPWMTYGAVFRLWPLVLILLGAETLYSVRKYENFRYDFGAVCMSILIGLLTVFMACASLFMEWAEGHPGFYI